MIENITQEIAEISGIHAGDGYMRIRDKKFEVDISGNLEENEYYDNHVVPLFNNIFKLNIKGQYFYPRNTYGFRTYKKEVALLLKELGFPSGNKTTIVKVPEQILNSDDVRMIKRFLRGYFDTDGCLYFSNKHYKFKNKHSYPLISFATVSKNLAEGLNKLFKSLNLRFFTYIKKVKEKNWHDEILFCFSGVKNLNFFVSEIGMKNPSKYSKYLIWKKFGFCPSNTTYQQRKDILNGILDANSFYEPTGNRTQI